jgi:hypothetical protein
MQIHFIPSSVFLKGIDYFPACGEKCLKHAGKESNLTFRKTREHNESE